MNQSEHNYIYDICSKKVAMLKAVKFKVFELLKSGYSGFYNVSSSVLEELLIFENLESNDVEVGKLWDLLTSAIYFNRKKNEKYCNRMRCR